VSILKVEPSAINTEAEFSFANISVEGNITVGTAVISATETGDIAFTTPAGAIEFNSNTVNFLSNVAVEGPQGTVGYTGSAGANGTIGVDGYTGSAGTNGFTGSIGYTGSAATTGIITTSNTAPVSPSAGDWWYYTTSDVLLRYMNVGTGTHWIDVSGPTYNFGISSVTTTEINLSAGIPTSIEYLIVAGGGGGGTGSWTQYGGGGGGSYTTYRGTGGGGVGILGQGANGAAGTSVYTSGAPTAGGGGSGGTNGTVTLGNDLKTGGPYGGAGGSFATGFSSANAGWLAGAAGAVRIIWGTGRAFPSTNTADI